MIDSTGRDKILGTIRQEIADKRAVAEGTADPVRRARLFEQANLRAEVAEEEAAAIAAEVADRTS